jgi:xylan 1,4-beta-xylosidase
VLSGVELGKEGKKASRVEVMASSTRGGHLEIWLDDLKEGKLIAKIPVSSTGGDNNWKAFGKALSGVWRNHDVFIKYPAGNDPAVLIKSIRFLRGS